MIDSEKHIKLFKQVLNSYGPIGQVSFDKIIDLAKFRVVNKGDVILLKGQIAKKMFFVCEGILISQWIDQEANMHIKNFFLQGKFAASTVSLLKNTPSEFGLECIEDGVILEMDYKKYKQLITEHNDLKNFYIAYLEENWIVKNEKRQISFAALSATERYEDFLKEHPSLPSRVSQWLIASYLGITPTQLSRIRKKINKTNPHQHM